MTIKIDIEQTTFPGELGSKADFAAIIVAGGATYEFDLAETKGFLSNSIYSIFETLKDCDPQALQAIAESYELGTSIIFNDQELAEAETQDVLDVCKTTLGMQF
ncbi:hypothetical protein [Rhizobium sp. MHM7A]|uniref:hypothetical protein n=1 Tax=Rhizobium sp. MHM7A TaxID=2583233 RepID=UPI0011064EF7|nr:hypothetical protein [Rhizobium sp. MHM7A]TLX17018.1 hypothetical protein FFR93_06805 [Rhizobium sp. MHM7A]